MRAPGIFEKVGHPVNAELLKITSELFYRSVISLGVFIHEVHCHNFFLSSFMTHIDHNGSLL